MRERGVHFNDRNHSGVTTPTCSKAHVHELVHHDGHLAVTEGMLHHLPLQMLVPGVSGVDGHRRVAQHGLNTSGCHDNLLI